MKSFHNFSRQGESRRRVCLLVVAVFGVAFGSAVSALGELPSWIRNLDASTALEAVFFRAMSLPGGTVLFRRPPRETRPALADLIKAQPRKAELYCLRAREDEQQLDFSAAESDWKSYVQNSADKIEAELALADFYHRRLRPADEIKTLSLVANAAPIPTEKLIPAAQQRSWLAFERIFSVVQAQGLAKDASIPQYRAWIARYPQEQSLYARFLQFLVAQKEYAAAGQLIADYHKQFPEEQVFAVKAKAMVEYRRGSAREGLAVYEREFQPLWDPGLVKSYFDLLRETQNLRKFLDQARATVSANPEDLNATTRIFYYYQQQGKLEAAQQTIADFRLHKEANKSSWTARELYVCARLLEDIHVYPEAARYYFALYNSKDMADAQERAIAGLTNLLLTAPETPIRFGSGELSMYRDIATMDQGPGYWNGILSLILNTTEPASNYSTEEERAVPYFHRSRAAELLAALDARFPNSSHRAELHVRLLEFYSATAESDAVIHGGREFLTSFPTSPQRTAVALLMAEAYSRKDDTANEFAIYDAALQELAAQAQNMPLGSDAERLASPYRHTANDQEDVEGNEGGEESPTGLPEESGSRRRLGQVFQIGSTASSVPQTGAHSSEYARVLERYLARLTQMKRILQALGVLRHEIDRNPDDPGLYERLAAFLDQNQLGAEQEEVYRRAIARFPDRSWYDKLARFYLRHKRNSDFEQLTRDAVKSFNGSDLEQYFDNVSGGSPTLYLRLNQYANQRFPHNPIFVRNLLSAYQTSATRDPAAWEALLRQHWFEEASLRDEFFEFLSRTASWKRNWPRYVRVRRTLRVGRAIPPLPIFIANANLWRSHFEESAPMLQVPCRQYPAELEIARTRPRSIVRWHISNRADTADRVRRSKTTCCRQPAEIPKLMARIGDIYADRD